METRYFLTIIILIIIIIIMYYYYYYYFSPHLGLPQGMDRLEGGGMAGREKRAAVCSSLLCTGFQLAPLHSYWFSASLSLSTPG